MNAFDFIYHIIHYIDGTNKDIVTEVKKWFIIFDIYESYYFDPAPRIHRATTE